LYLHKETGVEVEEIGGFGNILTLPLDEVDHPVCFTLLEDDPEINFLKKDDDMVGHWREMKAMNKQHLFLA
jgi:hypothetical protein